MIGAYKAARSCRAILQAGNWTGSSRVANRRVRRADRDRAERPQGPSTDTEALARSAIEPLSAAGEERRRKLVSDRLRRRPGLDLGGVCALRGRHQRRAGAIRLQRCELRGVGTVSPPAFYFASPNAIGFQGKTGATKPRDRVGAELAPPISTIVLRTAGARAAPLRINAHRAPHSIRSGAYRCWPFRAPTRKPDTIKPTGDRPLTAPARLLLAFCKRSPFAAWTKRPRSSTVSCRFSC